MTVPPTPDGRARSRRLAIGDPQAPIDRFFAILDLHGALGAGGRLRPEVFLVSMGDHFDWGAPADRRHATRSGLELLSWLAGHPADQVVILLGNHDLGRVCELAAFPDDAAYAAARAEADLAYRLGNPDPVLEAALLARFPHLASAETIARDYSDFCIAQRELLTRLLRGGRARLAHAAADDLLLVHAGVTRDDLAAIGLTGSAASSAPAAAAALNAHLDAAVARWSDGQPLDLMPLHQPCDAILGEGRGILYQRPADPARQEQALLAGPPRRRFDPRSIPLGLTQGIGHIRDGKCRTLLAPWVEPEPEQDGPLRGLVTDGVSVRYGRAAVAAAAAGRRDDTGAILFLDGGMNHTAPERYELLDLTARAAAARHV